MTIRTTITLAVAVVAVTAAALVMPMAKPHMQMAPATASPVSADAAAPLMPAIVRLHLPDGRFFCSGTVINKTSILTAAHCVEGAPEGPSVSIRTNDGKDIGIMASVAGANGRADYAVLRGDFSKFQSMPIITDPKTVLAEFFDQAQPITACGFPWSGALYCSPVTDRRTEYFSISAIANLFPGMSGGPVIDSQGRIIGVNTAGDHERMILSPIIELFAALGISAE